MSARGGLLGGLRLRNVRPELNNVATQRRLLNHFAAKGRVPDSDVQEEIQRRKQNGYSQPFTLAVKDNIATTTPAVPMTCGSPFLLNYTSPLEATIVTQLRARGAVLVGKTNLDEFGMGSHSTHSALGPVAQDSRGRGSSIDESGLLFSAGGSSGGSAVAVAYGEAAVALGTDTGGSVRLPAAYTGVVGFKPSYGMLSRYGVVPYANSLDTVGLLARSVEEIAGLIVGDGERGGLWAEHDPKDPTSLSAAARRRCAAGREGYHAKSESAGPSPTEKATNDNSPEKALEGIKFGIPLEYNIQELDPRIRNAWATTASLLQTLGARIVPVSLPSTRHALSAYYVIAPAEASSNLAKYDGVRYGTKANNTNHTSDNDKDAVLYSAVRGAGFGHEVKRRILLGAYTLSSEAMDNYFIQAQKVRRLVRRDFDRAFTLSNPLLGGGAGEEEVIDDNDTTFDLSDLPESIPMENKFGPTQVDFLLCPTAPTLAPLLDDVVNGDGEGDKNRVLDAYMNDVFTVPASLAGLPAISIPVCVGTAGSAGLQLIGQYWDDARLLKVAGVMARCLGRLD